MLNDNNINVGDTIIIVDKTSGMYGLTGKVLEIDTIDAPDYPYVIDVKLLHQKKPARSLFSRDEIDTMAAS